MNCEQNNDWYITCRCKHTALHNEFLKSPMGLDLPTDQYQCPACSVSWKLEASEPDTVTVAGQCIPGKREIVLVGGML